MRLMDAQAGNVDSAAFQTLDRDRYHYRMVQVSLSAAANVKVQGRNAPDLPWIDIYTFSASGAQSISVWREMRASVTGNTGTVTVHLDI